MTRMRNQLNILMAQINPTVGDLAANSKKIIKIIEEYQSQKDLIVFPELALTGYPLEDLVFRREFHTILSDYLAKIKSLVQEAYVLIGHPSLEKGHRYNSISLIHQGKVIQRYHKQKLPNYEVFDESRYFSPGLKEASVLAIKEFKIGLCICEDLWQPGPVEDLIASGVDLILSPNASPFDPSKYARREALLSNFAAQGVSFIYVNQTGGQDDILFDGQSIAMDKNGQVCARAKAFEEDLCSVVYSKTGMQGQITPLLSHEALVYKALVCGTRDYVLKNQFEGVVLGLSGGIDSALTLCIAVDALGCEKVHALILPSRFSLPMSQEDAEQQCKALKVSYSNLSIEPAFEAILSTLAPVFGNKPFDLTEENIQARIRGLLLMAISNKTKKMVLCTSNKSEVAVGYSTLYGDMVGGLAVLKDVLKTEVYTLARYRNSCSFVIPNRVLSRGPSAELRANQLDEDSLPEYAVLDAIIVAYMVDELSPDAIIHRGFPAEVVYQVVHLIQSNEYKRRQGPPGLKISPIAFGKDWRYPLTNGFRRSLNPIE